MFESKKFELTPSISIIIAGIVIAGAIVFTNTQAAAPQGGGQEAPTVQTNVRAPLTTDHRFGSATASVVLIEYSDLECYYCGQAYPTLKRLVEESAGQLAWIHRHLPLESIHPEARPAALASECVAEQLGDEGFWKFTDAMFADQSKMNSAYFAQVAQQLGIDMKTFNSCVSSEKYASRVDADAAEATQNGANGTPYTIIWSKKEQAAVSGALPYANFAAVIKAFKDRQ